MISIEELAIFCKKKGFVYQNSEIYGGLAGFWDFGHLGAELKNNIKAAWWKTFVHSRNDIVGIDGAIITNPKVWQASGHAEHFIDIFVECKKCRHRERADIVIEKELGISVEGLSVQAIGKIIKDNALVCPRCSGELSEPLPFNLMFETRIGPIEGSISYLRPETAQLIFANFKLVQEHSRLSPPFGIAQIGKAFRNEIAPREFLFRMREFEQMEIEYFVHPEQLDSCPFIDEVKELQINLLTAKEQEDGKKEASKAKINSLIKLGLTTPWHAYWIGLFYKWFLDLGIKPSNLRIREHLQKELAHYAGSCFDIEYKFPFGWREIHGNADRKQFDLLQHMNASKTDMQLYDEKTKRKYIPYIAAEPSQGVERAFLAFMFDAYNFDKERGHVVLKLHPTLAPVKVGIFPLLTNKPALVKKAQEVYNILKERFNCLFDKTGSIGRRYARADEIGIPICITCDFQTLKDDTVTLRDRNTTKQVRAKISELGSLIEKFFKGEKFELLGKLIS